MAWRPGLRNTTLGPTIAEFSLGRGRRLLYDGVGLPTVPPWPLPPSVSPRRRGPPSMGWRSATLPLFAVAALALPSAQAAPPPFEKAGPAFFQKHCVACHNAKTKRADVTLHQIRTAADLIEH